MKRTRITTAIALLLALSLSGCGLAIQQAKADTTGDDIVEEESLEAGLKARYPFKDFPSDAYPAKPEAAKDGTVAPTEIATDLFQAKFEGDEVSGSGGAVGGAYRFIATETDGESWHVKLECNYPTVAGRDYFVTYNFNSDVAGKVKFGDFQEFQIQQGENSITGIFTAKEGTSYLDLQLGMLQPFTIDFTKVEVKEYADEVDFEDALPTPVNFERVSRVFEKHDEGYSTYLARAKHAVNVNYVSSNLDSGVWKSRLYVRTGLVPEPGTHYRVLVDVMSDEDMPFEVLFNDGDVEKGYGALYGKELTANKVTTCEAVITGNGNGDELILQFSLGEAPEDSMVIVGNVHVDKIVDHYTNSLPAGYALDESVATGKMIDELVPVAYSDNMLTGFSYTSIDTVYEQHDDGYVVRLKEGKSSATMAIVQAPANAADRGVWKAKLYAATGVSLQSGTSYRVQFDLDSTNNQSDYEVCFDGDTENAYGALYGRSLTAGGTDHIDMLLTPDANLGPLTIRIQLGKTDTARGNTVTLKNLSVESVKLTYKNVLPADFSYKTPKQTKPKEEYRSVLPDDFSYDTGVNVWEEHDDVYTAEVSADGSTATLNITQAPESESERGVWRSKLFINTGVTPEAGQKYVISFDVKGDKAQGNYEACFDGDYENAYGPVYYRSLTAGDTDHIEHFFTPEDSHGPLVIRLQLGKTDDTSGNKVTVSNLKIAPITSVGTPIPLNNFKYPETTESTTVPGEYAAQPLSLSASHIAWDDSEASSSSSGSSATLKVTKPRNGGGDWSIRLHANTGVTLEEGVQYRISGNLTSTEALDFQVLYSNGNDENDSYNPGGKGYNDGDYGLHVDAGGLYAINKEITVPNLSEYHDLVLRIQVGNSPAPNTITVSDIKVEKLMPEHEEGGTTEKNSFDLEVNNGAAAELTGDGSSATAKVVTPGDDWHIKLYAKPEVALEAGKTYQITMNVTGADGQQVCFKNASSTADNAEVAFGSETISGGAVTHTVTPSEGEGGTLEILLKLGTVGADTKVKVSGIAIEELSVTEGDNLMTDELVAWAPVHKWTDAGYAATLTNDDSSATMNFSSVADEKSDWKAKLYVETGAKLKAGKRYRIRYNLETDNKFTYHVFYGSAAEEKAAGEFYNLIAGGAEEHEVKPSSDVELIIQLLIGYTDAPNKVKISNVQVDEIVGGEGSDANTPINAWAHEDYKTSLSNTGSSASIAITKVPSKDREGWKVKLFAETGAQLKAGKTYRVSVDVKSSNPLSYDICYNNREVESELGAQYGLNASKTKQTVTYNVTPQNDAVLFLQFNLGNASKASTVTISNVKVEEVVYSSAKDVIPNFRYDSVGYLSKASDEGYVTSLDRSRGSATFRIKQAPAERHAWCAKVIVDTGITPRSGMGYRVSFNVDAAKQQNLFELFCDGTEELAYGALYEQQLSPGRNAIEYTIMPGDSKGKLTLQLRFGETNSMSGNTYTISDFKVEEVTFVQQLRPEIKEVCELATQPGYTATLSKSPDNAVVKIVDTPETELEAWKNKLFVYTGVVFEPNQKYRVSFNVKSIIPAPFEVCFNKSDEEKGIGGIFGLTSKPYGEFVEFTTYAKEEAPLVIQLSLGNIIAPNTIFLSDVKVEKAGKINLVSDTIYTFE